MHVPRTTHLHAVKRSFCYLQGTLEHGLWFRPTSTPTLVVAYSDADWACCKDTCFSTAGYAIFLSPNVIAWHFKKQPTVSKSSTETEIQGYWLYSC